MRGWHVQRLKIGEAWDSYKTRGEGVRVALLDSGVSPIEPLRHVRRYTAEGEEQREDISDASPEAHGTQTAAIIASRGQRLPGVAPDADYLAFNVADITGDPLPSLVGRAMSKAVDLGAEVICCAFTLSEETDEFHAGLAKVREAGVPLVVAAGNDPRATPAFPLERHQVVTVAATSRSDRVSKHYRWEPWIPVSAPGRMIPTWTGRGDISLRFSGTSAATPIVAGVAALGLARAKALDRSGELALEVRKRMPELLQETSRFAARDRRVDPSAFLAAVSELAKE
jgi:subtilisin family serine protease